MREAPAMAFASPIAVSNHGSVLHFACVSGIRGHPSGTTNTTWQRRNTNLRCLRISNLPFLLSRKAIRPIYYGTRPLFQAACNALSSQALDGNDHKQQGPDLSSRPHASSDQRTGQHPSPGFLAWITFDWVKPLTDLGYTRPLEKKDIQWSLPSLLDSERNVAALQDAWEKNKGQSGALARSLYLAFPDRFWFSLCFRASLVTLSLANPLILKAFLKHIGNPSANPLVGVALAVSLSCCAALYGLGMQWYYWIGMQTSLKIRASVLGMTYNKLMKMNLRERKRFPTGRLVNLATVDADGLMIMAWAALYDLIIVPFQLSAHGWILFSLLGPAALAGLGSLLALSPLTFYLPRLKAAVERRALRANDVRVHLVEEMLSSIRVIKLLGLEPYFKQKLQKARTSQVALVRQATILGAFITFLVIIIPAAVSVFMFGTYVLLGNQLTPPLTFASLAVVSLLRRTLDAMPGQLNAVTRFLVSQRRLHKFFLAEEKDDFITAVDSNHVKLTSADFHWAVDMDDPTDPTDAVATLADINIDVKSKLCLVAGPVGCGKSTLLSGLLGEVQCLSGDVQVPTRVAYTSQQPWLLNDTLRGNILFGRPLDRARYAEVLRVCALERDVELLPAGDLTEIGDRGTNLSGGQKQRIALARAVYGDANVYLFDDPLAAVDAHVGEWIFSKCIVEFLEGKTRIIVTHQLQHAPSADHIILMSAGRIANQGTYPELLAAGITFESLQDSLTDSIPHTTESTSTVRSTPSPPPSSNDSISVGGTHVPTPHTTTHTPSDSVTIHNDVRRTSRSQSPSASSSGQSPSPVLSPDVAPEGHGRGRSRGHGLGQIWGRKPASSEAEGMSALDNLPATRSHVSAAVENEDNTFEYEAAVMDDDDQSDTSPLGSIQDGTDLDSDFGSDSDPDPRLFEGQDWEGGIQKEPEREEREKEIEKRPRPTVEITDAIASSSRRGSKGGVSTASSMAGSSGPATPAGQSASDPVDSRFATSAGGPAGRPGSESESESDSDRTRRGRMIQREEVATGGVDPAVWGVYYDAAGGMLGAALVVGAGVLGQGLNIATDWWLSAWSSGKLTAFSTNQTLAVFATLAALMGMVVLVRCFIISTVTLRASTRLHDGLVTALLQARQYFFDITPSGRIMNRISKDVHVTDDNLPTAIQDIVTCGLLVCGSLVLIVGTSPFTIFPLIVLGVVYSRTQEYYRRSSRQMKRLEAVSRSPIYTWFAESAAGLITIRAFKRMGQFRDMCLCRVDNNTRLFYVSFAINRWIGIRLELIAALVLLIAALTSVISHSRIGAGLAGLMVLSAMELSGSLNWLVRQLTELEVQMSSVERILDYSKCPQEGSSGSGAVPLNGSWPSAGAVCMKDLVVSYREGAKPILSGISCSIQPGEKIGVVGRTGAGKSTLALALYRILEASSGTVYIDGVDISKVSLDILRSRLAIIPQDPILFTGSIRSNLDPFGTCTDEELWKAVRRIGLEVLVREHPKGLDFPVDKAGENLSVGQRQLVCLGRAMLRRSRILVMDEATASLDYDTDQLMQRLIRREFASCTVITIAHRIHTVMDCDRILVLDAGSIAEFESPEVLLTNPDGIFYSLVRESEASRVSILPSTATPAMSASPHP